MTSEINSPKNNDNADDKFNINEIGPGDDIAKLTNIEV